MNKVLLRWLTDALKVIKDLSDFDDGEIQAIRYPTPSIAIEACEIMLEYGWHVKTFSADNYEIFVLFVKLEGGK